MTAEFLTRHEPFDLVLMNGVLHHLDDETVHEVLRLSHTALRPGGKLVTLDGYYGDNLNPTAQYLLSLDRVKFIRRIRLNILRSQEPCFRKFCLTTTPTIFGFLTPRW